MKAALDAGCNFWNGGEFYGTPEYNSLHLLEKYFTKYPEDADKVVLSIKGGMNPKTFQPVDNVLKLLNGKKKLDIFECARVDKNTPIETTMKVLEEEYVKTGKLGGISLSEVGPVTIQKAAKATKIVAVEVEVSLTAIDVFQNGVAKACAENDILMVAYVIPLGLFWRPTDNE
jgi:pyridoxine 4-dehydrogenase